METKHTAVVSIVMGSDSDLSIMQAAGSFLQQIQIPFELTIVSAHRTPQRLMHFAEEAKNRGLQVIIAGAGGAAHLPGMIASVTNIPVIGVPIKSSNSIDGWDSILSILQMPNGVPVATVALNGAKNAAILAAQILALNNKIIANALDNLKKQMQTEVENKITETAKIWNNEFDKK